MSLPSCTPSASRSRADRFHVTGLAIFALGLGARALLGSRSTGLTPDTWDFIQGATLGSGMGLLLLSIILRRRDRRG